MNFCLFIVVLKHKEEQHIIEEKKLKSDCDHLMLIFNQLKDQYISNKEDSQKLSEQNTLLSDQNDDLNMIIKQKDKKLM